MLIFCLNSGMLPFGHTQAVLLQELFIKVVTFLLRTHLENMLLLLWWFDVGNAMYCMQKLCTVTGVAEVCLSSNSQTLCSEN